MRVLHVNNHHRGVGGSDAACKGTIKTCMERGLDVGVFARDSKDLPAGLRGKAKAFFGGVYSRSAVREFDEMLLSFRPDVVHIHELFPLISPWILPRCTEAGIPIVMTCYDFRITCPVATHYTNGAMCHECSGGREYRSIINNCRSNFPESLAYGLRSAVARRFGLFTKHVSRFIALTEFSKTWLVEKAGIPLSRIAIIPCVVPAPAIGVDDPSKGEYVGYAGRFVPEKGVEMLIEACRKERLPLRLAGDSLSHPAIRVGDDIQCIPTPNRAALDNFYRSVRMLVVPSLWEETFATVMSEAKAHGVAVIGARIGAIPDLVDDGVTGLLFEAGNVDDLAKKIRRIWDDDDLCRRLGAAARRNVQEELNEDVCFDRLLAVYRDVSCKPVASAA